MALALTAGLLIACGSGLPRPPLAAVDPDDYRPVPFSPRVPPVEFIPPSPAKDAVWVDGSWEWTGTQYGWRYGTWTVPPAGARYARWTIVRREEDGQLFFAPASWRDSAGKPLESRAFMRAFGSRGRARTRPGTGGGGGVVGRDRPEAFGRVERIDMDVDDDLSDE